MAVAVPAGAVAMAAVGMAAVAMAAVAIAAVGGMAVAIAAVAMAVGVADAHPDTTSANTRRIGNTIVFFIIILFRTGLKAFCASQISIYIYYLLFINITLNIILINN